ncbi:S-4TM family putative pore-forming effector [uncultured Winogradskyella sp.]|uniref:S-4TM family putative pore-forming effector n=1 Tax=uncultured Winogradskyella sp. TaxID=395353 RepID=UPI0030EE2ADA|tara:strand:+ start:1129 stop:2061 length:933 start_codon:yes stop_codon:yes gene_type:complete
MGKQGTKILERQNRDYHIDELLAQKTIYSRAKNYQGLLIILTVPLPIIISLVIKFNPSLIDQSGYIFVLYTIIAATSEKILESTIDRLKKIAASIKELFDTEVLGIIDNDSLNLVLIDREIVRRYSNKKRKSQKEIDLVTNWYSLEIKKIKTNVASLICQRTNITYDFSVRKRYKFLIIVLSVITFLILFAISLSRDLSLKDFVIEVILPSIPVIMFAYKEINSNTESIDNLNHLRNLIESLIKEIKINEKIDKHQLRSIQNRIYHNRLLSPLIPDFIYKLLRPKLEDEMDYSVKEQIKILRTTTYITHS